MTLHKRKGVFSVHLRYIFQNVRARFCICLATKNRVRSGLKRARN